jgi:hypothetical protein
MVQLLLWMVMAYGLSNILVYGSIFNGPRNFIFNQADHGFRIFTGFFKFLKGMLSCMMCTPVWVGFFFGIFLYSPVHEMLEVHKYYSWFFDGMLASGAVWAINAIIEWFEVNRPSPNH